MKNLILLTACAVALSACATTNEMPLAPNVVRLDTQASGALFAGSAGRITMKRAAQATLNRGYTHFRLEQASTSQGRQLVGVNSWNNGTFSANTYGSSTYGSYNSSGSAMPVYAPTANVGVTVIMFRKGDAGARGAWDAAEVLKKEGNV
ncbi:MULTISPECIES: hypothetical protein [Brucella/Ochrobactrum group]|uniref:hypothetical protein n=1 Tax=Brucella/Ochrobactrum group TaxID=2826938 RepID=UPI000D7054D8|nr:MULTISPECIES: hypothetical protein [Brucella/Ochrobactrum group]MCH4539945.1 hypothetical protein [Ochrobactrum sp. A-1]PWU77103.1 hypothetical protein DK867_01460 [Ochrobactrum sp. POC9]